MGVPSRAGVFPMTHCGSSRITCFPPATQNYCRCEEHTKSSMQAMRRKRLSSLHRPPVPRKKVGRKVRTGFINGAARLIGGKAYDSARLDRDLADRYGIEMIAPNRGGRRKPTQDGRPSRRYRRRWRVEQLFAWLHHFRRLVIRWEYHVEDFFGTVRLGCMQILLGIYDRLLVAQRHHGVDLCGAACRDVASQQCGGDQKQYHCGKS